MLRNLLTQHEIDMITEFRIQGMESDFDAGSTATSEPMMPTNEWLRYWAASKAALAPPFQESLILKKRISFVPQQERERAMENLVCCDSTFLLFHKINSVLNDLNELNFPPNASYYAHFSEFFFREVLTTKNLLSNRYIGTSITITLPNGKTLSLEPGVKMSRFLGKMAKAVSELSNYEDVYYEYETFRIKHSQILNETVNGTLCLSIHPLDFMTASYNNNNWRSCMEWFDGEYRRGVIEMMNSPIVICAYIESDNTTINIDLRNDGEWNSKKWREFFIVSPELISGIKGYPYCNKDIEKIALDWLKEIYSPTFKVTYEKDCRIYTPSRQKYPIRTSEGDTKISNLYFTTGSAMYNDFYGNQQYHMYFNTNLGELPLLTVDYSGASECVHCGKVFEDFDSEHALICNQCINYLYCDVCGERIRAGEDSFEINGTIYCTCCYDNLPQCEECGMTYDPTLDNRFESYLIGISEKFYLETFPHHHCDCCADRIFKKSGLLYDNFSNFFNRWGDRIPIISPEELSSQGREMLNISHDDLMTMYRSAADEIRRDIKNRIIDVDKEIPNIFKKIEWRF